MPGTFCATGWSRAPGDADMAALKASIAARGQQTPIEVIDRGEGATPRYGLISGWRRLAALGALHGETGAARFATIRALLRRPESAADAYQAMVEENEIRASLSYWERARVVARAADQGVFADERAALSALFAHASRPRRSKIGTFLTLYRAFEDVLRHPAALPERRGLALAQALAADPALPRRLAAALRDVDPADAEAEQAAIDALLRPPPRPAPAPKGAPRTTRPSPSPSPVAAAASSSPAPASTTRSSPTCAPGSPPAPDRFARETWQAVLYGRLRDPSACFAALPRRPASGCCAHAPTRPRGPSRGPGTRPRVSGSVRFVRPAGTGCRSSTAGGRHGSRSWPLPT